MKKIYILSAAALLAATMGSCRKEEPQVRPDSGDADFYASIESADTKTSIAQDGTVQWCKGDRISVNGGVYVVSGISSPNSASFKHESGPEAEAPYFAFYPSTIQSSDSLGYLPAVWQYKPSSPSVLPMYAHSESNKLNFRNVCAALKVSVNPDTIVTKIKVKAGTGSYLSGAFVVHNGDSLALTNTKESCTDSCVLNCGEGVYGTDFYLPIPAGEIGNLVVTLTTENATYDLISADTAVIIFKNNTIYPIDFMCRDPRAEADAVYQFMADHLMSAKDGDYSPFFAAFNLCGDDVMAAGYDGQSDLFEFNTLTYDTENEVVSSALDGIISTINETNKFIEYWNHRSTKPDGTKTCIAEMRVLKAYLHILMGMAWNNAPIIDSVLTVDYAKKLENVTRDELFKRCLEELQKSEENLLDDDIAIKLGNNVRIAKSFCWLVQSKIYLYLDKKDDAKNYAEKVINSQHKLYTEKVSDLTAYEQLFHFNSYDFYNTSEYILLANSSPSAEELAFFDWRTSAFRMDPAAFYTGNLQGSGFLGVRKSFCDEWSVDFSKCDRANSSLMKISDAVYCTKNPWEGNYHEIANWGYITGKVDPAAIGIRAEGMKGQSLILPFKSLSKATDIYNQKFIVARVAEAYLIAAETETTPEEQKKRIDALRQRSLASTYTSYSLDSVKKEWNREMFLEGQRWINQVRWADQSETKALEANRVVSTLYDTLTRKPAKDEEVIWENGTQDKSRFYIVTDTIKTPALSTKYYHFPYPSWFLKMFPKCTQDPLWSGK